MKAVKKLAVLIGLVALLPLAVSARTPEQAYLAASTKAPGVPVPVAVVSPSISPSYAGAQVNLAFTVDTRGVPTEFAVVSSPDAAIAKLVMDAVRQWRFAPAERNGAPVATKVVLPVRVAVPDRYAAVD